MNYSFEYIDIILLAMIAGFIFLRLRGILGKKTSFEEDVSSSFPHEMPEKKSDVKRKLIMNECKCDVCSKCRECIGGYESYETYDPLVTRFKNSIKDTCEKHHIYIN